MSGSAAGQDWSASASLPGLRAVIDPEDRIGAKNDMIDRIHRRALVAAVSASGQTRYVDVVDFGCGIGRLSPHLLRFGKRVFGVDPVDKMLERAREACQDPRLSFLPLDDLPELCPPVLIVSVYVLQIISRPMLVQSLARLAALAGPEAGLIVLDRIARSADARPENIEARSVEWYARALGEAGWAFAGHRKVRRADSYLIRLNVQLARTRLRWLQKRVAPPLAYLEMYRAHRRGFGEYVDVVMWATRQPLLAEARSQ